MGKTAVMFWVLTPITVFIVLAAISFAVNSGQIRSPDFYANY
jgi:hypothetical protein